MLQDIRTEIENTRSWYHYWENWHREIRKALHGHEGGTRKRDGFFTEDNETEFQGLLDEMKDEQTSRFCWNDACNKMGHFKKILTLFGNYISIRINSSCLHAILLRISCRESFWQFKMKVSKKSLWETSETEGYVSALTLAELVYVMRKEQNQKGVHDILSFYDASDWISSCNDPFTQSFLFCYH